MASPKVKLAIPSEDPTSLCGSTHLLMSQTSPCSHLIGGPLPASPTPRFVPIQSPVVATTAVWPCVILLPVLSWLCVLLHSLRVPRLSGRPHSVFALLQSPRFPALQKSPMVTFACACLFVERHSDNVFVTFHATITKHLRLSGVYTPKFAYDSPPLFQLIHHSTASTAVVWWKSLIRVLRTACTVVCYISLHLLGNLRAVSTTANHIFWDVSNIEAHPPLLPIITLPDINSFVSPWRLPPLRPIITPPDTDTYQPSTYLRAQPPLPPIITPPDTDVPSHPKFPHYFSAPFVSVTLRSKLGHLLANVTACPGR
jgi:hypothetical protein